MSPTSETATYDPFHDTRSVPAPAPELVAGSGRAERLLAAGWVDVRRLGHGGMGELYVGFDPGLQRSVVAKFIRPTALNDSVRKRFRVEAAALARLDHPNVARLFAYAEGDDPHLVLEYVDGGTLADRIKAGPLSAQEAAALLEAVARGVAAAHAAAVIHRDLKPSNILLDRTGPTVAPKVTDFGMAKDADAVESLTQADAVLGTPEYMSPEQAASRSGECDGRSDVWGLAATLYAAVTGQPPYTRDLRNPPVLTDPLTPPEAHVPGLPPDMVAVIRMGLEKHANDRYQSAAAFADDLKRYLDGQPVQARRRAWPVRVWRRVQRLPRVATAAVLVALLCLGLLGAAYFGGDPTPERKIARKMAAINAGKEVTVIPETGLPDWFETLIGSVTPVTTGEANGATVVGSISKSVVAFTPPIPCDAYELTLDLLEVRGIAVQGPNQLPIHRFGPIIGLRTILTPEGPLGVGWCVLYHDTNRGAKPPYDMTHARFGHAWFSPLLKKTPQALQHGAFSQPFLPSRPLGGEGRWRSHRFEVSPDRIQAFWNDDNGAWICYADVGANDLVRYTASSASSYLDAGGSPVAFPQWSPQGAIGLYTENANVGIRNLVVRPRKPLLDH